MIGDVLGFTVVIDHDYGRSVGATVFADAETAEQHAQALRKLERDALDEFGGAPSRITVAQLVEVEANDCPRPNVPGHLRLVGEP